MADALAAQQNPDGGFGYTVGVRQSDVDDTSYAIEFLRTAAPRTHTATIERAEAYLLARRNPDGGFPTFAAGAPSEVAMTAAVNALAGNPAHRAVAERGVAFIVSQGGPAGVLERGWSRNLTNAVFRATLACATVRDDAPAALRKAASASSEPGFWSPARPPPWTTARWCDRTVNTP
ncbi:prenyltransferase/squalene oxidase repeat-containing protein [Streptomyces sp. NPDC048254]|uniref:prenyltransferase/squalene oxidase repeat-containing protein n=1 Tax=Streptomyces sp. NPDC048254 TaxID=3365525 RepID=UPI003712A07E